MKNNLSPTINQIPFKFDSRYVFSDTHRRIYRIVSDVKSVENLIMSTQLPYVFTTSPIPLTFNYNLCEGMLKESYSKVVWSITNKNIFSPISITFDLTRNTIEKTVLVIFSMEIIKRELIPQEYIPKINTAFPKICIEMINYLEKELEEDNKDIYNYVSKIFNYARKKIWDIIVNFHKIMEEQNIIKICKIEPAEIQKGTEIEFIINNKNQFCKLKVNKLKQNKDNNKWLMEIIPISGPFNYICNDWTLIELKEDETMVANLHKFAEHLDAESFQKMTDDKIEMFKTIENILKKNEEYKEKDN
jgi:ribosome-associated toxin RatA of RatAB toxin-antitoxin module